MKEKLRFLGLDFQCPTPPAASTRYSPSDLLHAETIAVAVADPDREVRSLGTIPNRGESIRKVIKKLGPAEKLRACYGQYTRRPWFRRSQPDR